MEPSEPQRDQYTVGWICALPIEATVATAMLDKEYRPLPMKNARDSNTYVLGSIGEHNVVIASLPMGIDFGKVTSTGFKRTGLLNHPPVALLTALSRLEVDRNLGWGKVPTYLKDMYSKYSALRKAAKYLGPELDKLFRAEYKHETTSSVSCQDCDVTFLVSREPRDNEDPVIQYGTIGSGNQIIKDGHTRDRLQKEHGILCFEMEAAGIMNNFPCLVIRGICDYFDSHKSKGWQGYAAATAAAFSKELLRAVPALHVDSTRRAVDVLEGISAKLTNISSVIHESTTDKQSEKIVRWLSPADPSANYNRVLEDRHRGSGAWLIGSELFYEWESSIRSAMWLHGLPGCGKTVLSASIIKALQRGDSNVTKTNKRTVLYFYFDFSDKKKQLLNDLARSLVSQLYHHNDGSWDLMDTLFSSCKNGNEQPTTKSLLATLSQMLHNQTEVYVVLDALDECTSRKDLLCWVERFVASEHNSVQFVFTSRKEDDIESCLSRNSVAEYRIAIQAGSVNEDIQAYIHTRLQSDKEFERWQQREDVQLEIEEKIMEKADGMFRWAACQVDALAKCTDLPMLRKALDSLPTTLYETYARILVSIPAEYKSNAIRILQFLIYSGRALRIEQVVDAIAVNFDDETPFEEKTGCQNLMKS